MMALIAVSPTAGAINLQNSLFISLLAGNRRVETGSTATASATNIYWYLAVFLLGGRTFDHRYDPRNVGSLAGDRLSRAPEVIRAMMAINSLDHLGGHSQIPSRLPSRHTALH